MNTRATNVTPFLRRDTPSCRPESISTFRPRIPLRVTFTKPSPSLTEPCDVHSDQLQKLLERLDVEQLQILEIIAAAMCRGAL